MNTMPKHQHGLTFISLIFFLAVFGFFILLILKIGPIYLNHSKVTNALAALEKETDVAMKSEAEVRASLDKRFNMNYVEGVTKDDIKVTKSGNYLKVQIAYEKIEKIVGNLSVLVEFDNSIEVGASE